MVYLIFKLRNGRVKKINVIHVYKLAKVIYFEISPQIHFEENLIHYLKFSFKILNTKNKFLTHKIERNKIIKNVCYYYYSIFGSS